MYLRNILGLVDYHRACEMLRPRALRHALQANRLGFVSGIGIIAIKLIAGNYCTSSLSPSDICAKKSKQSAPTLTTDSTELPLHYYGGTKTRTLDLENGHFTKSSYDAPIRLYH